MSQIFGPTRQLGIVVTDFMATLRHWTQVQGIGPFFYFTDTPVEDYRYRGEEAEPPLLSIAFAYSGDLQIEIICQQNSAPSCYLDFLSTGREGLQHISSFQDRAGFEERLDKARRSGLSPINEGAIGGVRFAYFDTHTIPGATVCEISESDMDEPRALFDDMRHQATTWDGTNPLRRLSVD